MITRLLLSVRFTPMPVGFPLAQKASSNGTQVHCSLGALIGMPRGMLPPLPELALEVSPEEPEVPAPPDPDPEVLELFWLSTPLEQAATAKEVRSEASERA